MLPIYIKAPELKARKIAWMIGYFNSEIPTPIAIPNGDEKIKVIIKRNLVEFLRSASLTPSDKAEGMLWMRIAIQRMTRFVFEVMIPAATSSRIEWIIKAQANTKAGIISEFLGDGLTTTQS